MLVSLNISITNLYSITLRDINKNNLLLEVKMTRMMYWGLKELYIGKMRGSRTMKGRYQQKRRRGTARAQSWLEFKMLLHL